MKKPPLQDPIMLGIKSKRGLHRVPTICMWLVCIGIQNRGPLYGPWWWIVERRRFCGILMSTVEARKLEHDRPPTPKQRTKENQHKSSYIHVPSCWSLLYLEVRGTYHWVITLLLSPS